MINKINHYNLTYYISGNIRGIEFSRISQEGQIRKFENLSEIIIIIVLLKKRKFANSKLREKSQN